VRAFIYFSLLALVLVFFFSNCKKKEPVPVAQNPVPSVPVNISIYPNDPLYFKVQAIGGWMYLDGGINGIVLYRKTEQEFVALERSSTKSPSDAKSRVLVQSDNFTLKDTVSASTWSILDGSVMKGPAVWPLRKYGSTYDGNLLKIIN
jgi:hypothetical protein